MINLPGVGRKTANVYLNILFDEPRIGVDTHVFRVSNRIGLTQACVKPMRFETRKTCVSTPILGSSKSIFR